VTETRPTCPTLVESPEDPTASLVCFLGEGHDGEWHYDPRGLGASFRIADGQTTVRFSVSPSQAAAQQDSPPAPHLPAPIGDASGQLDADALRALAPVLRRDLVAALRHAATLHRQARGTVVVEEDTYGLVRRVVAAGESLRSMAEAFTAAAREADAIAEEEALTVSGAEADGVLLSSLFVPDGQGQRIKVSGDWESGSSTWDVSSLVGWLVDDEVDNARTLSRQDTGALYEEEDLRQTARDAIARLVGLDGLPGLGKFTPGAKPVEELRKRLAEAGRDKDAAVIRQVRTVGQRRYRGVKVTREEAK
jgi:hypothetical protein